MSTYCISFLFIFHLAVSIKMHLIICLFVCFFSYFHLFLNPNPSYCRSCLESTLPYHLCVCLSGISATVRSKRLVPRLRLVCLYNSVLLKILFYGSFLQINRHNNSVCSTNVMVSISREHPC